MLPKLASSPRILMVYPEFFPTYWGMQYYLPLVNRKALMPPLGLITIAAMCPPEWEIRVVDMNCGPLTDEDLAWADLILFSAMLPQKTTMFKAAERCRRAGKFLICGGPYPTACPEECKPYFDVVIMNEGEVTWPMFLEDVKDGHYLPLYTSEEKPDVTQTPCPRFDLLRNIYDYAIIPIQFSRGCPFQCEFCDIIVMYGRRPRTKTPQQLCAELDAVNATGFRGSVFIVDDNFIGNKREVFKLLPEIKSWNEAHGNPFYFGTEASVNLAEDPELVRQMVESGFIWVFMGIETPSTESLKETKKFQNTRGSLVDLVKIVQHAGLLVYGGFIIGFDSDSEDIFDRQIEFIRQAAIPSVMLGPLVALPGTPLYKRMKQEGRLVASIDDHNRTTASGYTNILTKIPHKQLTEGHLKILKTIYNPAEYFERTAEAFSRLPRSKSIRGRLKTFLWLASLIFKNMTAKKIEGPDAKLSFRKRLKTFFGIFEKFPEDYRRESGKFARTILKTRWEQFPRVLGYILMGYHYYKYTFDHVVPDLTQKIEELSRQEMARPKNSETLAA